MSLHPDSKPFYPSSSASTTPVSRHSNNEMTPHRKSSSEYKKSSHRKVHASMAGYNLNFPSVNDTNDVETVNEQAKFSYKDILTSKPMSMLPNNLEPIFSNTIHSSSSNVQSPNQPKSSMEKTTNLSTQFITKKVISDIPIIDKKKKSKKPKEFTLADHIGEDIVKKLNPTEKSSKPSEKKNFNQKDDIKKSVSKMNRIERAFLSKGDTKGMRPIRLEIRSEDASKITNEDVYNAFIKAVTNGKENSSEEALVHVLTKKKKPNKLKKLILKEKEIRKLHNIAPSEYLDVKNFLKNLRALKENSNETESGDGADVVIEILPEKIRENIQNEEQDPIVEGSTSESDSEEALVADQDMDILSVAESMEVVVKGSNERKIREYVYYPLDPDYENLIFQMLTKLQFYQFRLKKTDKKKFKQRLRYVIGIREVLKGLKLKKIRAVVIAPNIDKVTTPGGLDTKIEEIIEKCKELEIPVFFALTKKKLGISMKTSTKISIVGLYSMDGAFDEFKKAKQIVENKIEIIEKQKKEQLEMESNKESTSIELSESMK